MSQDYKLFYYWDEHPIHGMPPYISLCLESWKKHAQTDRITRISLDNVDRATNGALTSATLRLFTPAQRSDAVMSVVLSWQSGIFMDADTVLLPNFDPSRYMRKERPSMYCTFGKGTPEPLLAFLANPYKEDRRFMSRWASETLQKTRREEKSLLRCTRRLFRTLLGKKVHVRWDYLGGAILNNLASETDMRWSAEFLSAKKCGFLPEAGRDGYGPDIVNEYWFSDGSDIAFSPSDYPDGIVALQNSWIPVELKAMSESEILSHQSRFGKLLSYALR